MTDTNQNTQQPDTRKNPYLVPGSIVIAGMFIAGAIFFGQGASSNASQRAAPDGGGNDSSAQQQQPASEEDAIKIKPITSEDHIKGDPNASVKIVEFADPECPFCKRFHSTMQQVIEEYDGQVAWVYRHFPLDSIHSKARREAAALELANELGGNEAFWTYMDRLYEITPSNDGLQLSQLVQIAEDVGLPTEPFQELVDENDTRGGKYAEHIEEDYQDAVTAGGRGTPYSTVIAPNGKKFPLSGAQPYSSVKSLIELALQEQ